MINIFHINLQMLEEIKKYLWMLSRLVMNIFIEQI